MNRIRLHHLYASLLLVIAALIVLHAPLSVWFSTMLPDYTLLFKSWKEILLLVGLCMALAVVAQKHAWKRFANDRLLQAILALAIVHLVSLVQWNGALAVMAGLAIDLRFLLYFALVYVLLSLYPGYKKAFYKVFLAGAVFVIGFASLQLLLPADALKVLGYSSTTIEPYLTVDQNPDFIRLQSSLRGPNPLGAYAMGVVVLCAAWVLSRRKQLDWYALVLGALALLAVYNSHSRSAFLATAAGLAIVALYHFRKYLTPARWAAIGISAALVVGAVFVLRSNDFVSNVVFHEDPEEAGVINSNDGHLKSLQYGTKRLISQPFGEGIGSTGSASLLGDSPRIIENQYLLVAHEAGWIGLALFIAVFVIVMKRLWMRRLDPIALGVFASGAGLALIGLLLPVWADDTISLVWWGLAAVVCSLPLKSFSK